METRANYVIVGIFTLIAILAAFALRLLVGSHWRARRHDHAARPHSGLGLGAQPRQLRAVQWREGRRRPARLSRRQQSELLPLPIRKSTNSPQITKSTQADIGLAGLTGQANIELKGANTSEPNLLDEAAARGQGRRDHCQPFGRDQSAADGTRTSSTRADVVLTNLEGFTNDVRGPLTETAANAQKFSEALARNSEGVDKFLANVSALSEELAGVSGKLDGTLKAAEGLLNSVDPDQGQEYRRQYRHVHNQSRQAGRPDR